METEGPEKMNRNKIFGIIVLVAAVVVFVALKSFYKTDQPETPKISSADLIKDHSPSLGPVDAPVQIVEFLDPECEACRTMDPIVKGLIKEFDGKVRLVIRYMPFHPNSMRAATVLEEAREHGKYWEALSVLFYNQPQWGDHHEPRPDLIPGFLSGLGLTDEMLKEDKVLSKHQWKIDLDFADGKKLGITRTPTFIINGKVLSEIGYEPLKTAIQGELSKLGRD